MVPRLAQFYVRVYTSALVSMTVDSFVSIPSVIYDSLNLQRFSPMQPLNRGGICAKSPLRTQSERSFSPPWDVGVKGCAAAPYSLINKIG
jgi:hypothetical protein